MKDIKISVTIEKNSEININEGGYSEASFDIKEVVGTEGYDHTIITTGSIGEEMVRHLPTLVTVARAAVDNPNEENLAALKKWVKQYEDGW